MSGIFGFSVKQKCVDAMSMHALDVWNRYYGYACTDTILYENIGMGCHLEHLSENYSCSAPILKMDKCIAVIDAVLYNREDLFEILQKKIEKTVSDEELLICLIQQEGYSVLAQINGDFAGAVYDKALRTWTLFRDHLGIRPLYYYRDKNIFAFSTDMRGIIALPNVDLAINEKKLYLRINGYNDLSLCETEYERIRCIHPGSWTVINEKDNGFELQEHIYWKLGQKKIRMKSDKEYQEELKRLITDSVKRRLDAVTGLVGCELSGGLDSSIIAILISRLGRKGRFYSWSDSPIDLPIRAGEDERKIIQDICKQENIFCEYAEKSEFKSVSQVYEKIDPPYINTRYISKGSEYLRKQGAKVVFTGHGGDEGVSHRCNLYELWYHHEFLSFIKLIYRGTNNQSLRYLRTLKRVFHQIFVVNPYFRKPFLKKHLHGLCLLNRDFVERMETIVKPQSLCFAYNPIGYIMQGGTRVRLDNVAVQGAENGVRYMMPYLDYRVIDYAVSIPRAQYKNERTNRYIFRKAFEDIMPQSLRDMHYKDAPSQRDYQPDYDVRARFLQMKKEIIDILDKNYWEEYLDFDIIENISLGQDCTWSDCVIASGMIDELMICGAIQNVKDKARKWSEEHE